MTAGFSTELIEHARKTKGVAPDWDYKMCENNCGELVFVPPGILATPARIICSAQCATELLGGR